MAEMKDPRIKDGDAIVIASPKDRLDWVQAECELARCLICRVEVWVTTESRRRVALGAHLLCVQCALSVTEGEEIRLANPDSTAPTGMEFLSLRAIQEADSYVED